MHVSQLSFLQNIYFLVTSKDNPGHLYNFYIDGTREKHLIKSQDTMQNKCLKRRQEGSVLPLGVCSLYTVTKAEAISFYVASLSLSLEQVGLPRVSSTSEELAMGQAREEE